MAQAPELWLPDPYAKMMTDQDHLIHEQWQETSLQEVVGDMQHWPEEVELANGDTITYFDLPVEDGDSTEAVALLLPFNNGYNPSTHIRAAVAQSFLHKPTRFMVFPNGAKAYDFAEGTPIKEAMAQGVVEAAVRAGVERLHVVGSSQGAMVGAAMLESMPDKFDISDTGVYLADAPNTIDRTEKELTSDFKGDGLKALRALKKAINDSALPALSKAQRSRGGLDAPLQMWGLASFGLTGSFRDANKRFHQAMTKDDFLDDILVAAELPRRLVVARFAASLICYPQLGIQLARAGLGRTYHEVQDYGHEGSDNVVLNALEARCAIEG